MNEDDMKRRAQMWVYLVSTIFENDKLGIFGTENTEMQETMSQFIQEGLAFESYENRLGDCRAYILTPAGVKYAKESLASGSINFE